MWDEGRARRTRPGGVVWRHGMRQLEPAYRRYLFRLVAVLLVVLGAVTSLSALGAADQMLRPAGLFAMGLLGVAGGLVPRPSRRAPTRRSIACRHRSSTRSSSARAC